MERKAIIFKLDSTEVAFYEDEIARQLIKTVTPRIVSRLKNGKPIIYLTGEPYRVTEIAFYLSRGDYAGEDGTRTKIETLRNYTGIMMFYYRYGYDEAYTYAMHVQMVKSDVLEPHFAGYPRANMNVTAVFYEASTGKATPAPHLIKVTGA